MLLAHLLESADLKAAESLPQKLHNSRLIVRFQEDLRVPQPKDVLDDHVDGIPLVVDTFPRHSMSENRPAQAVLHDEHLQCLIIIKAFLALLNNRALARQECVVHTHDGYAVRIWNSTMAPLATMAFVAFIAP